jgi:hypothetical protein
VRHSVTVNERYFTEGTKTCQGNSSKRLCRFHFVFTEGKELDKAVSTATVYFIGTHRIVCYVVS